jgi:two-component system, response regulator / RNA-binding antiterminator
MLRVMMVGDSADSRCRSPSVREMLEQAGYTVVAEVSGSRGLGEGMRAHAPDVLIVDTESPSCDTLERLAQLSEHTPRPIVMFSSDRDSNTIRAAVEAGVSAYIVDGLAAERMKPIVEVAIARFESFQAVRAELAQVKTKLSERKTVERAKGLLMKARSINEDEAYAALRKMAMERSLTIGEVSRQFLAVSDLLG